MYDDNMPEESSLLSEDDRWKLEIDLSKKYLEGFKKRGRELVKKYRAESDFGDESSSNPYHIFWSNVQTLAPSIYSDTPVPKVKRRFKDQDPVGRVAAEILQRATQFCLKNDDFNEPVTQARDDVLIPGVGQCWLRYEPSFIGEGEEKELAFQKIKIEYLHWQDFIFSPARNWQEVRWVGRVVYMTEEQLKARFKEKAENIPLNYSSELVEENEQAKEQQAFKKAKIYEIWDKPSRTVIWFCEGSKKIIEKKKDFLKLRNFFPCPRPLFATLTTDSLIPRADYDMYQDDAELLKEITSQINYFVDALRVAGVYNASCESVGRLFSENVKNELIPEANWDQFSQAGGLKGAIDFLPLQEIAYALDRLYDAQAKTLQRIYEITGISDIVRGQGNPYETAEAQRTKAQFATRRIDEKRREIQRFVRELVQIQGEIIAEHFDPKILRMMTGVDFMIQFVQHPEQTDAYYDAAVKLLQDDKLRSFRIEIETDSTLSVDPQVEKQQRVELLTSITQFLQAAQTAGAAEPGLVPLLGELLKYGIRGFEGGRELESVLEESIDAMKQKALQPPAPPPPDPQMLKVQQDGQIKQQELQLRQQELQMQGQELQLKFKELELKTFEIQSQINLDTERIRGNLQIEAGRLRQGQEENMRKSQIEAMRIQGQSQDNAFRTQAQAGVAQMRNEVQKEADRTKAQLKAMELEQKGRLSSAQLQQKAREIESKTVLSAADIAQKSELSRLNMMKPDNSDEK